MKKVVISGYYGFGNSGDEAILSTIIKDLKELDANINITVLSIKPSETVAQHGVFAVNRYNIFQVIASIKSCDLLIFGGGSLIQDITSTRSLLYYLYILRTAIRLKRKVMFYANGIGPVNDIKNRERASKVLNSVDVITLRETDSFKLLEEMKVDKPEIIVTADPVLTFRQSDKKRLDEIFEREGIPMSSQLVGINLREWMALGNLEEEIADSIDYMYDRYGLQPVFIPMAEADRGISERVRSKLKCSSFILEEVYLPEDLIGIIGRMKMAIAMRLHTLIYASINSVPMIGLVYDPKIKGYMEYINQAATGDVDSVKAENLNLIIDGIMSDYEEKQSNLRAIIDRLKMQSKRNAEIAYELINKKSKV